MEASQRRLRLVFLLVSLGLIASALTGCGAQTPAVALDEEYAPEGSMISLNYPTGWSVVESAQNSVSLVSTADWPESEAEPEDLCYMIIGIARYDADQVAIAKVADPNFALVVKNDMPTADELSTVVLMGFMEQTEALAVKKTRLRINGMLASTLEEPVNTFEDRQMQVYIVDLEEGNFILSATAANEANMASCESTGMAITKSVRYTPQAE